MTRFKVFALYQLKTLGIEYICSKIGYAVQSSMNLLMLENLSLSLFKKGISLSYGLGMSPFYFNLEGILLVDRSRRWALLNSIWLFIVISSALIPIMEFAQTFQRNSVGDERRFFTLSFQAFLIEVHLIALFNLPGLQRNTENLPQLVNSVQNMCLFLEKFATRKMRRKSQIMLNLISIAVFFDCFMIGITIPMVSFLFPWVHQPILRVLFRNSEFAIFLWVRSIGAVVNFILTLCAVVPAATILSIALMFLSGIVLKLKLLRIFIRLNGNKNQQNNQLSLLYRQLQIFGVLSNDCFKTYTWTTIQFNGAICTIFPLNRNRAGWMAKFVRSSKPVAMQLGSFYKMDRKLGPSFVRFCAHRTVFLVMQTESLSHHDSDSFLGR
ncbi:unnamed protein product [Orchesella dallaii]|uniref:G protein-coupled receptor n=1 Tax=Orchesella dallaii TaxID=48710 RepID=A0ABP1RK08_9HEXA